MKLIACNSNIELAKAISSYVGHGLADATIRKFADGEVFVKIDENIRGEDIFIIQSTFPPTDNLMELLLMIDAVKRIGVEELRVIPKIEKFFGTYESILSKFRHDISHCFIVSV